MEGAGKRLGGWLTLLVALGACTSGPPLPTQPGTTASPVGSGPHAATPLADAGDCQRRILAADLANSATVDDVDECRFVEGGEAGAAAVLAAGGTRDQLWAAVWVYGTAGADPAPLLPMVSNTDASIRVIAAAALARLGQASGLDALTAALSEDGFVAGSLPPERIDQFASFTLSRVVVADDAPPIESDDAPAAWSTWLQANRAALVYDQSDGEWSAP